VLLIICLLVSSLFFLTATGNTAKATDYYLDAVNGDDSDNNGSSAEPWKTIAKAESTVANGDTVYLRSGPYGEVYINRAGLNRNSWVDGVTYMAEPNATPVFDKLYITGTQNRYITFKGISITSPSDLSVDWEALVLIRDSSHVKIIDCNLTGTWIPDGDKLAIHYYVRYGVFVDGLSNGVYDVIIDGCDIQGVSRGIIFYHDIRDGMILRNSNIYLISESHITTNTNHNNGEIIIEGNHLYDRRMTPGAHGAGIALRDSRITVRGNKIHDYGGSGGIRFYGYPPVGYQVNDILIENNLVYDAQGTTHMYFGEIGRNITVRNNTFIGWHGNSSGTNKYQAVAYFGPKADKSNVAEDVFVYNNIFVGLVDVDSDITNFNENNNIFWAFKYEGNYLDNPLGTDSIIIHGSSGLNPGYDENYFEGSSNFFVGGALFDQYSFAQRGTSQAHKQDLSDAYQLAADSNAIDFGDPAHAPGVDAEHPRGVDITGRDRDEIPDAGCYEFGAGSPDTTDPSDPQNLTATTVSESQIYLSWDASTDPESGISYYKIYRDGAGTPIDTSVSTSYSDTGLDPNTDYTYEVSAVNGQGLESNKSNIASEATPADTTPPTIQSVSVSETSVAIVFSETLDTNSAENKDFYKIKSGPNDISVMAASLGVDLITVTLTTLPHVEGSYTLTVEAVLDISGNPIVSPASIDYEYTIGLVGYWKFDEATGNTAFDSSGSGLDGTLVNGPTWTTGKIGSALLFDGTNNYVDIGAQDIATPWAASFWVKREDSSNSNAALLDSSNYSLKLEQYPNLNKVGFSTYGVADYVFNYEAPINTWAHLVFVGSQTQVTLYVDGALAETITASISCPMAQISSISRATKGAVDEVRIYNRALNAAEVSELYDAGTIPVTHTLGVWASNGSVTKIPDKASYNHSEEVTLQPEPDTGYSFVNWSGDLTGSSNPATIVMDDDKLVTANFTITVNTYTLNMTADHGSVTKTPDQATYDNGTTVTLQALANTGYTFAGWSGDTSGTSNTTTVVMDGNKSVTANFTINTYTLGITAANGSVAKTPDQASYNHGTTVTLQATAITGYNFVSWSGDASGSSNPTTVVMDGNKSVTANFTINTYTISASAGSNGQISPDGITQVNYGDSQAYTITADSGYKISEVMVNGSSVGAVISYSFTNVTANRTIAASFVIDEIDVTAPTVTNLSPQADSIQAHLNTLITLDITDPGDGVDANSVTIEVNNDTVYSGNTAKHSSTYGECYRWGTKANYRFTYQSKERFNFDQTITVTVNATDLAGNSTNEYSYYFQTKMRSFGKNKKVNKNKQVNVEYGEFGSTSINNDRPTTCRDSEGNIWATWHAGATSNKDIYVNKLTAGSEAFEYSIKLTDSTADHRNPTIAVGNDDKLYVAWQDSRRGNWDIYVSTSTDGVNWSAETRVTDSNDNQYYPAIVVDNSNNVYIVWEDSRNGNQDIYIAKSNNGFVSTTVSQITSDLAYQSEPAIAVDSDNTVYVVWTDTRNSKNDIYGAASNNGPWTNIPIINTEDSQSSPAIATEDVGSILHLVWVDNTPGDNDIYYAQTDGGLPSSPLTGRSIIDDPGEDQLLPVIVATGSTGNDLRIFVCWEDERSADIDLYFAELGTGSGTNVFVDDDGTNTGQADPAIGIDGDGYPYLVWTDNRNTNTDIYYAGSTSIESTALASGNISTSSTTTVETADGVSVVVPAGAYPCDIKITISELKNSPKTSKEYLSLLYDFGPSGIEFDPPVTIMIPYEVPASGYSTSAYWYNLLTSAPSQQGITDIETIVISSTSYLRFKTTHFTQFFVGGSSGSISGSGGGGGGGCSMSADSQASAVELLLPYIGLTVTMVVLKLKDKRKRKARNFK
jgi:uncharacterized repeat protein (TIGR02543 family)